MAFTFRSQLQGVWPGYLACHPRPNIAVNISASALDEDHFHLAGEVFEGETAVTLADWLVLWRLSNIQDWPEKLTL